MSSLSDWSQRCSPEAISGIGNCTHAAGSSDRRSSSTVTGETRAERIRRERRRNRSAMGAQDKAIAEPTPSEWESAMEYGAGPPKQTGVLPTHPDLW